jgi:hypothetical protein
MSAAQKLLAVERRNLANSIHKAAAHAWQLGRAHRVAGYTPEMKWREDFYYMAGYNGERRKEKAV